MINRIWPLFGILAGIAAVASILIDQPKPPDTKYIVITTTPVWHKTYIVNNETGKQIGCFRWNSDHLTPISC